MFMPRTRLGVIVHFAKRTYLTISYKPRMAIRHDDFKGRTDLRPFCLHKKKRRFGQAEPLTSPRVGSVPSHLQAFILALSPIKFIPSLGRYALSLRVCKCRDPREAISRHFLLSQFRVLLQGEVSQRSPECQNHAGLAWTKTKLARVIGGKKRSGS